MSATITNTLKRPGWSVSVKEDQCPRKQNRRGTADSTTCTAVATARAPNAKKNEPHHKPEGTGLVPRKRQRGGEAAPAPVPDGAACGRRSPRLAATQEFARTYPPYRVCDPAPPICTAVVPWGVASQTNQPAAVPDSPMHMTTSGSEAAPTKQVHFHVPHATSGLSTWKGATRGLHEAAESAQLPVASAEGSVAVNMRPGAHDDPDIGVRDEMMLGNLPMSAPSLLYHRAGILSTIGHTTLTPPTTSN